MVEVCENLYVGNQIDFENEVKFQDDWFVIQACKEPYHRSALGYSGRAAPKTHPEYLIAKREGKLILNLVDAPDPKYISKEIIDEAIYAIEENIKNGKVLLHCNQGMSRSATIGLLYLKKAGILKSATFAEAEEEFLKLYPNYNPAGGMRGYAQNHWDEY
jgi:hypothetical protein